MEAVATKSLFNNILGQPLSVAQYQPVQHIIELNLQQRYIPSDLPYLTIGYLFDILGIVSDVHILYNFAQCDGDISVHPHGSELLDILKTVGLTHSLYLPGEWGDTPILHNADYNRIVTNTLGCVIVILTPSYLATMQDLQADVAYQFRSLLNTLHLSSKIIVIISDPTLLSPDTWPNLGGGGGAKLAALQPTIINWQESTHKASLLSSIDRMHPYNQRIGSLLRQERHLLMSELHTVRQSHTLALSPLLAERKRTAEGTYRQREIMTAKQLYQTLCSDIIAEVGTEHIDSMVTEFWSARCDITVGDVADAEARMRYIIYLYYDLFIRNNGLLLDADYDILADFANMMIREVYILPNYALDIGLRLLDFCLKPLLSQHAFEGSLVFPTVPCSFPELIQYVKSHDRPSVEKLVKAAVYLYQRNGEGGVPSNQIKVSPTYDLAKAGLEVCERIYGREDLPHTAEMQLFFVQTTLLSLRTAPNRLSSALYTKITKEASSLIAELIEKFTAGGGEYIIKGILCCEAQGDLHLLQRQTDEARDKYNSILKSDISILFLEVRRRVELKLAAMSGSKNSWWGEWFGYTNAKEDSDYDPSSLHCPVGRTEELRNYLTRLSNNRFVGIRWKIILVNNSAFTLDYKNSGGDTSFFYTSIRDSFPVAPESSTGWIVIRNSGIPVAWIVGAEYVRGFVSFTLTTALRTYVVVLGFWRVQWGRNAAGIVIRAIDGSLPSDLTDGVDATGEVKNYNQLCSTVFSQTGSDEHLFSKQTTEFKVTGEFDNGHGRLECRFTLSPIISP